MSLALNVCEERSLKEESKTATPVSSRSVTPVAGRSLAPMVQLLSPSRSSSAVPRCSSTPLRSSRLRTVTNPSEIVDSGVLTSGPSDAKAKEATQAEDSLNETRESTQAGDTLSEAGESTQDEAQEKKGRSFTLPSVSGKKKGKSITQAPGLPAPVSDPVKALHGAFEHEQVSMEQDKRGLLGGRPSDGSDADVDIDDRPSDGSHAVSDGDAAGSAGLGVNHGNGITTGNDNDKTAALDDSLHASAATAAVDDVSVATDIGSSAVDDGKGTMTHCGSSPRQSDQDRPLPNNKEPEPDKTRWPSWLQSAYGFLVESSPLSNWRSLIRMFLEFESMLGFPNGPVSHLLDY